MIRNPVRSFAVGAILISMTVCLLYSGHVMAATTAKITPDGDSIEMEYTREDGSKGKETIPIYRAGNIRYFSSGVGADERSARYPSFSLKLIFVAGPKAYLSQVSVTIKEAGGKVSVEVPREQVAGPWLFVDLPSGTYEIMALGPSQLKVKTRVTIAAKQTKTVYLRWKGETT